MKISYAILTHNEGEYNDKLFSLLTKFKRKEDEIVIVDDFSDINIYNKLYELIKVLNTDNKIKLLRNDENLKPFLNKIKAVKSCKNDWIILLDSDNKISDDYVNKVLSINRNNKTVYIPQLLVREDDKGWDYFDFRDIDFNKDNIKNILIQESPTSLNAETMLNTGNFFINRDSYIKTIEDSEIDISISTNDSLYFSYLWLKNGNIIKVLPDLKYYHYVHDGSWYIKNWERCQIDTEILKKRILEL
jgi:GT2 family glycosyltransferase